MIEVRAVPNSQPSGTRRARARWAGALAFLAVVFLHAGPLVAPATAEEPGAWFVWNGTLMFTDHWSVFTEAQLRLVQGAPNPEDALVRLSGHYDFTPEAMAGFGYLHGKVWEDPGAEDRIENRLYGQFGLRQHWDRTIFEHRYRIEQRWFRWASGRTDTRQRVRYRLQVTVPLFWRHRQSGMVFLNSNNEFFINVGDSRAFDQNRFYVAGGVQFGPLANLQVGYMWIARTSVDQHRLWVFFTHNFDFRGGADG
jgi:hypothetical protein